MNSFFEALRERPVISAVRDMDGIRRSARSRAPALFLLGGSILTLPEMAARARDTGKRVFIHLDLLDGLGHDGAAVEWCAAYARPDGLISTRAPLLKRARECGLMTIQRVFVMDSSSLQQGVRLLKSGGPDMVEILPGLVSKAIREFSGLPGGPAVIAGGMVTEKSEIRQALAAGARAVSTSREALWNLTRGDFLSEDEP